MTEGAFRVPAERAYTDLLGRAVYNFAYLEWAVIYTVETLSPGYLAKYTGASRPIPSGQVATSFREQVSAHLDLPAQLRSHLDACASRFTKLVDDRNRLVHAHPYTAEGGVQQLGYQGRLPPALWPLSDLEATAYEFDSAACEMNSAFHQLREALALAGQKGS